MNKRTINQPIATHQAATTPTAVREVLRAAKGRNYRNLITAAGVRTGAADALREVLASELAKA